MDHSPAGHHLRAGRLGLDCSCQRWRGAVDLEGTMEEAEEALRRLHARHALVMGRPEARPGPWLAPMGSAGEDG